MGSWPRGLQCAVQVWPQRGRGTNRSLTGGTSATELLTPAVMVAAQHCLQQPALTSTTAHTEMSHRARPGQISRQRPIVLKSIAGFQNSSLLLQAHRKSILSLPLRERMDF